MGPPTYMRIGRREVYVPDPFEEWDYEYDSGPTHFRVALDSILAENGLFHRLAGAKPEVELVDLRAKLADDPAKIVPGGEDGTEPSQKEAPPTPPTQTLTSVEAQPPAGPPTRRKLWLDWSRDGAEDRRIRPEMPLPRQSSFVAERGPGELSGDQSRRATTPHTPLVVERVGRRRYAQLGCCQQLADDPARLFHVVRMGRSPASSWPMTQQDCSRWLGLDGGTSSSAQTFLWQSPPERPGPASACMVCGGWIPGAAGTRRR
ncbi:hypothetical protein QBC37DRAFT_380260 [Rhypophila decipiens]|uniref:Uncharacterized protein n=1 Tax=Rhypophila decipiens TaxID=261697 RepID=A0AAN6XX33_9PEZI|nr:hypothetical protein QBC37DRAFT_380260 [Rhypophila decipiens]